MDSEDLFCGGPMLPTNDPDSDDEEGFSGDSWLRTAEVGRRGGDALLGALAGVARLLADYVRADGNNFYIVKEEDRLFKVIAENEDQLETEELGVIGPGTTIASYAGFTKNTIIVEEGTDMSNFPLGITPHQSSQIPVQVVCVPITSGDKELLGLMEFTRSKKLFSEVEISLCKTVSAWVGRGVKRQPEELVSQTQLYRHRLTDLRSYIQGAISLSNFISRTLKDLSAGFKVGYFTLGQGAPPYFLFLVKLDESMRCLRQNTSLAFLSEVLKSLQKRTEAQLINLYQTDLGTVFKMYGQVKEGLFLKSQQQQFDLKDNQYLRDIYEYHIGIKIDENAGATLLNPDFIEENKHITDFHLENYMCLPIGEPSKTLAILELINTKKEKGFTREDQELAVDLGRLCSAAFYYDKVLLANIKTESLYGDQQNQMNKNIVCQDFIEQFFKRAPLIVIPDHFYRFDFYPKKGADVDSLCWIIFKEVFDLDDLHDEASLKALYIIMAAKHFYKDNDYHNLQHAFNMCHCMFLIARNNKHIFTPTEIRALVVSTLLHDIDHPGFGNNFLKQAKTPLSQLYGSSYLENHHVYMAKQVVTRSQIFTYLKEKEYKLTMRLVEKAILHTDLATYFEKKKIIQGILEARNFDFNDPIQRDLLVGLTMTASDLVGQCKPFETAASLVRKLLTEQLIEAKMCQEIKIPFTGFFYKVGDIETAKSQIKFNEEISLPCFDILRKILVNVSPIYLGCKKNTEIWRKVAKGCLKWIPEQGVCVDVFA